MNQLRQLLSLFMMLSLAQFSFGQGDDCDMATTLSNGTFNVPMITAGGNSQTDAMSGAVWYTFTPTETVIATIASCFGGADTRVILWEGVCGPDLAFVDFNDDACPFMADGSDPGYASSLTANLFAGVTYYFEWDDRWDSNGFDFTFETSPIPNFDGALNGVIPYSQIPDSQIPGEDLEFLAAISNQGAGALTGLVATVNIYDAVDLSTPLYTQSSPMVDLPAYLDDTVIVVGTWPLPSSSLASYVVDYSLTSNEADEVAENNTGQYEFSVSQATLARDNGAVDGSLGVGDPGVVSQANTFDIYADDMITSVSANIGGGQAGDIVVLEVYEFDGITPGAVLASSMPYALEQGAPGWVTLPLMTPFAVTAGDQIAIGLSHTATGVNIGLRYSNENWTPGRSFVLAPAVNIVDWTEPSFVTNPQVNAVYQLRANFGDAVQSVTLCVQMTDEMVSPDGVHVAGNFNGWDPAATPMTDPDMDGIYSATIMVNAGEEIMYKFINGNTFATAEGVPAACGVDDGYGAFNRAMNIGFADVSCLPVCFGLCDVCPPDPCDVGIICDDFESYDASMPLGPQSPFWTTWSGTEGGAEDGIISTDQAHSGTQSMYIEGTAAGGGPQDVVLLLGDSTSGRYQFDFWIYIPAGSGAYYNIQHNFVPNAWEWASQITFNADGTAALDAGMPGAATFDFAHDTWIEISQIIDIDNDWTGIRVDGVNLYQWPFSWQATDFTGANVLAAVDFFPIDNTHAFYIDDVLFAPLPAVPAGNDCAMAMNLNSLVGQGESNVVSSMLFDNTNSTLSGFDPTTGWECFGEPDGAGAAPELNNTMWFEFIGDGNNYFIETSMCDATNYIIEGDTQMAIFADNCTNGTAVACSEDGPNAVAGNYIAGTEIQTEEDVTYYIMIDGFNFNGALSTGEFCITFEQLPLPMISMALCVDMNSYITAGELSPDGVFVAGTFNGFSASANEMTDPDGDGIYTADVSVPVNSTVDYLFLNGNFAGREQVPTDCGFDNGASVIVRRVEVADTNIPCTEVCFGECDAECDPLGGISVSELEFDNALSVFPNPATDVATIQYNFSEVLDLNVKMTNSLGQLIQQKVVSNTQTGTVNLDVKGLSAGVYFVEMTDGNVVKTERLFIEK